VPQATEGNVVIRVRASSFNYHDVFTVKGMPGIKVPLPVIIGLDMAGEIAEVGPGVAKWKAGDRVLVNPLNKKKGLMGEMLDGGMAEYCLVGRRPACRRADRRQLRGRGLAAGRLRHRAPHADHPQDREGRRPRHRARRLGRRRHRLRDPGEAPRRRGDRLRRRAKTRCAG
jgi:Zn-dependent alcohol dehydrogenase